ncbi:hypothetical protein MJO29_001734 [Puccinia striiformis f. sp. tritici]|nr:hypothetical protein MJO29_001734 [Puccinia striiformis f. sp. tritici]
MSYHPGYGTIGLLGNGDTSRGNIFHREHAKVYEDTHYQHKRNNCHVNSGDAPNGEAQRLAKRRNTNHQIASPAKRSLPVQSRGNDISGDNA